MSVRWVALLGATACSAAGSVKPAPPPPSPAPASTPYAPPRISPAPPFHVECHTFTPPPAPSARKKIYDFVAIEILPVRRGPRAADRPRVGLGRSTRDLRLALAGRAEEVTDCWKVASSRGASETSLDVAFTVEPLGGTRDVAVTSASASVTNDALAACVTRALTGLVVPGAATRSVRARLALAMKHADQPAWSAPWPAHAMSAPADERIGTQCTPVLDDGVVTDVRLPAPLAVTDYDDSRNPPRGVIPHIRIGCAISSIDADKRAVRTALTSNLGAYQACYADALDRDPALTGEVALQLRFSKSGTALAPRFVSGPGDAAFQACLVAALQDIWVTPGPMDDGGLEVNIPLALLPRPTAPKPDDAEALLAAGDPEGAIAAFARVARTERSPRAQCDVRAGVLRAVARSSPWLDDERTRVAIADLGRAAAELPMPLARACVEPIAPIIADLTRARGVPRGSWRFSAPWLERYAAALPLAPYLDDGVTIRWYHATALLSTARFAEGQQLLEKLAWDPQIGGLVASDLRDRTDRTEWLRDNCID